MVFESRERQERQKSRAQASHSYFAVPDTTLTVQLTPLTNGIRRQNMHPPSLSAFLVQNRRHDRVNVEAHDEQIEPPSYACPVATGISPGKRTRRDPPPSYTSNAAPPSSPCNAAAYSKQKTEDSYSTYAPDSKLGRECMQCHDRLAPLRRLTYPTCRYEGSNRQNYNSVVLYYILSDRHPTSKS